MSLRDSLTYQRPRAPLIDSESSGHEEQNEDKDGKEKAAGTHLASALLGHEGCGKRRTGLRENTHGLATEINLC
jgi:hypothetical protein